MPISKSAKKSLRVSLRKTSVNRHRKALIKAATKKVDASNVAKAVSMIDKGAKWGLFHPNKVARLKARLAKTAGLPTKDKTGQAVGSKPAAAKTKKAVAKAPAKKSATKAKK